MCGVAGYDQSRLRLVTVNVDGLGTYDVSPEERMDAILTEVLSAVHDVICFHEVHEDGMLATMCLRSPRAEWLVCRRERVDMPYFNVTLARKSWGACGEEQVAPISFLPAGPPSLDGVCAGMEHN